MTPKQSHRQTKQQQAMQKARDFLREHKVNFWEPDQWTIRIDDACYWPHKQRLYIDNEERSERNVDLHTLADKLGLHSTESIDIRPPATDEWYR